MLLNVTVEEVKKPVPLTVNVCGEEPAAREAGASVLIVGTGLFGEGVTVNTSAFEVVPATSGFVTAIEFEPDVARKLAGNRTVSEVGSVYVVDKRNPLNVA